VLPEDFKLPSITEIAPTTTSRTPFTDLILHPEKLEAALQTAREENDAFNAARAYGRNDANHAVPGNRSENHDMDKPADLKRVEFRLTAPTAAQVKLAGDFTDWEKSPLDMVKAANGAWLIWVPLLSGCYSYRFIVDGKWCDDPCADLYEPNVFGTGNAVIKVA